MKLFAMTAPGLEGILATELAELGMKPGGHVAGGVEFEASREGMLMANLWLRAANRIVVRLDEFHASSFHELERRAKRIEWTRVLSSGARVRFRVTCRKSKLYHSDAVAERLGNAAAGSAGATVEPDAKTESESEGGQLFIVRIANDVCTISADSSGALLHRRGYRQAVAKAPLRETIAAAMLIASGWDRKHPLVDPMCGSGTIPIEGAMMARRMAPGVGRRFAFEQWPDHDARLWDALIEKALASVLPSAGVRIAGSDRDAGAVAAAISNATRAGVESDIEFREQALSSVSFPAPAGWIVSNPPYGQRVGESVQLRNLYSRLGSMLREEARGYVLALLSADRALESQLRLPLNEAFRTTNGGIPVRLMVAAPPEPGA